MSTPTVDPSSAVAQLPWATMSQAERDDAYDNNKAVAASARLIAERDAASAAVRASRASALDIPYGAGERTKIDLFPAAAYGAPCLIFIHGGYWQRNSREVFAMIVEGVGAHGWSVAIPGYSLAPDASLTTIFAEIRQALDWMAASAPDYGIAGPLILSGWSAGAQLAALALDHPAVKAGLAISGVYDLEPIRGTRLNHALRLTDIEIATLSPLRLAPISKPLAIAYGAAEVPALVQDARSLHHKRTMAGAPGDLVAVADADHFSILEDLSSPDGKLVDIAMSLAVAD